MGRGRRGGEHDAPTPLTCGADGGNQPQGAQQRGKDPQALLHVIVQRKRHLRQRGVGCGSVTCRQWRQRRRRQQGNEHSAGLESLLADLGVAPRPSARQGGHPAALAGATQGSGRTAAGWGCSRKLCAMLRCVGNIQRAPRPTTSLLMRCRPLGRPVLPPLFPPCCQQTIWGDHFDGSHSFSLLPARPSASSETTGSPNCAAPLVRRPLCWPAAALPNPLPLVSARHLDFTLRLRSRPVKCERHGGAGNPIARAEGRCEPRWPADGRTSCGRSRVRALRSWQGKGWLPPPHHHRRRCRRTQPLLDRCPSASAQDWRPRPYLDNKGRWAAGWAPCPHGQHAAQRIRMRMRTCVWAARQVPPSLPRFPTTACQALTRAGTCGRTPLESSTT